MGLKRLIPELTVGCNVPDLLTDHPHVDTINSRNGPFDRFIALRGVPRNPLGFAIRGDLRYHLAGRRRPGGGSPRCGRATIEARFAPDGAAPHMLELLESLL